MKTIFVCVIIVSFICIPLYTLGQSKVDKDNLVAGVKADLRSKNIKVGSSKTFGSLAINPSQDMSIKSSEKKSYYAHSKLMANNLKPIFGQSASSALANESKPSQRSLTKELTPVQGARLFETEKKAGW